MNVDKIYIRHDTRWKCDLKTELHIHIPKREPIFLPAVPEKVGRPPKQKRLFYKYKKEVWRLTNEVAHLIPGIENRGFKRDHIDHIVSIWHGYKNGISIEEIASLSNLRMLNYLENMRKGIKVGVL